MFLNIVTYKRLDYRYTEDIYIFHHDLRVHNIRNEHIIQCI